MWLEREEGAKFWLPAMNKLKAARQGHRLASASSSSHLAA